MQVSRAAAGGASASGRMIDALARQMPRQRLANRNAFIFVRRRCGPCRDRRTLRRVFAAGGILGFGFLQLPDREFKLFDIAIELLRGTPEPRPPQRRQLRLQMFDMQGFGIDLVFENSVPALKFFGEGAKLIGIIRQGTQRTSHDYLNQNRVGIATDKRDRYLLLCDRRTLRRLRYEGASPVDTLHQHRKLSLR